jgi:DNA-binding transcriptional MerR regulator
MEFVPSKLYYKIGEVCEIVGVPAHVLRYWETEFPGLTPPKSKGGQRTYRPKDVELLLQIRRLLYDEGFTIAGARRQLTRRRVGVEARPEKPVPERPVKAAEKPPEEGSPKERLSEVREELENILTLLDRG